MQTNSTYQKSNLYNKVKESGLSIMEVSARAGLRYQRLYMALREGRVDPKTEKRVLEVLETGN